LNLKVLFVMFLCLFSASIICNTAMTMMNESEEWNWIGLTRTGDIGYLINNRIEPAGDPIGGGGWPGPT